MNALHKRHALSLAICLATLASFTAQAQQPPQDGVTKGRPLDEVIVTANRVPVPLRQIGTSVSVIDTADIEARGNLALSDVLRQMPAIAASNSGGPGKATSLRIRGEEGFRTLMIFDGMRLSDPSSTQVGPQVENLLSTGVGRVEVLRGPQGLSYGADAGGVVNISSRQSSGEGINVNIDAQGGKFGTRQLAANVGGGNALGDFFVSLADFETDGFNTRRTDTTGEKDFYENTTLHLRGGWNLSDAFRVELVHRDVSGETQYDGCGTRTVDCLGITDLQATRGALSYTGAGISHTLSYARTETDRDNLTDGVSSFAALGELGRWEYIGTATELPFVDLVWGGDVEEASMNGTGRNNTGLYGEVISDFSDQLHLTAGLRHDDNDHFGTNLSHRLSAAYLFDLANDAAIKLRTSYGTGFRAPSPYEIAYNAGPDASPPAAQVVLGQEESKGYEVGIEYLSDALHLEAVYFDQEVEDAIEFDVTNFSGYLQLPGTSRSTGVELGGEWTIDANWQLVVNYTYNETERPNGLPRRRRPEDLYNVGLSYYGMSERLNLNAYYRVSKNSIDSANPPLVRLDDFDVLDLSANFSINANIQVYGRIENALDEAYEEIATYNTARRAAYIGFRLNYAGL
jgi:vitamin B12 transporter